MGPSSRLLCFSYDKVAVDVVALQPRWSAEAAGRGAELGSAAGVQRAPVLPRPLYLLNSSWKDSLLRCRVSVRGVTGTGPRTGVGGL